MKSKKSENQELTEAQLSGVTGAGDYVNVNGAELPTKSPETCTVPLRHEVSREEWERIVAAKKGN